jgi:hypothetical protein
LEKINNGDESQLIKKICVLFQPQAGMPVLLLDTQKYLTFELTKSTVLAL